MSDISYSRYQYEMEPNRMYNGIIFYVNVYDVTAFQYFAVSRVIKAHISKRIT